MSSNWRDAARRNKKNNENKQTQEKIEAEQKAQLLQEKAVELTTFLASSEWKDAIALLGETNKLVNINYIMSFPDSPKLGYYTFYCISSNGLQKRVPTGNLMGYHNLETTPEQVIGSVIENGKNPNEVVSRIREELNRIASEIN